MQLSQPREISSLRHVFRHSNLSGADRHKLRNFNMLQVKSGKAQSARDLALSLGIDVQQKTLPRGMAGRLVQDPFSDTGYCIEVNKDHSVQSRRFSVLHELGHFVLEHSDKNDPLAHDLHLDRSSQAFYTEEWQESEANRFASTVLFGDGALSGAVSLYGRNVSKLAKLFGVSERAVEIGMRQYKV